MKHIGFWFWIWLVPLSLVFGVSRALESPLISGMIAGLSLWIMYEAGAADQRRVDKSDRNRSD